MDPNFWESSEKFPILRKIPLKFLTKVEIKKPLPLLPGQGITLNYPFDPIVDNPSTPLVDETEPKGIPSDSGDGVTPTRKRRHLDKTSKPPFTTY